MKHILILTFLLFTFYICDAQDLKSLAKENKPIILCLYKNDSSFCVKDNLIKYLNTLGIKNEYVITSIDIKSTNYFSNTFTDDYPTIMVLNPNLKILGLWYGKCKDEQYYSSLLNSIEKYKKDLVLWKM